MALMRTAKSCGPDASTLAFKSRGDIREATVTKKPDHRGEHEISCKTIARGMPGVSGVTVVTNARAYYPIHARLRAHQAPGIPCALCMRGRNEQAKTRANCAARI